MSRLPRLMPVLVLALGLLLANAATTRAGGVRAPASAASGDFAGQGDTGIAWRSCATDALPTRECGELAVPLSYREPQLGTISLAGARVPATDPARRIGSLSNKISQRWSPKRSARWSRAYASRTAGTT
jgi:hypothetical protein